MKANNMFSLYHPIGLFIYLISVIVITMFTINPIMLSIALAGGILYILIVTDIKSFLKGIIYEIPFFILIVITNPLFSHNGVTPLFFLNGNPITLEAILYGLDIGIMILAVIYWCKTYNLVFSDEKFIYLFGKTIPKLSLVLSMALKYIPLLKKQYRKMSDARKYMGYCNSEDFFAKVKNKLTVFSMLITWSFETSLDTAMSMKIKGYGLKGRTHFHNFRFGYRDGILLILTIIIDVIVFWGMTNKITQFYFYPSIAEGELNLFSVGVYGAFGILVFIPSFIEIKEKVKWKYYVERI